MTPDEAEAAGYQAWAAGDTAAYAEAVASARDAAFPPDAITARLKLLDGVAMRCVMSRTYAAFWRQVQQV